jgi:hypothetical protein
MLGAAEVGVTGLGVEDCRLVRQCKSYIDGLMAQDCPNVLYSGC